MKTTFISRLKSAMAKENLNQMELAKKSNIRQSSISDWLNGKYVPKQDKVDILAQTLNVSPAYLMGWEDKEEKKLKTVEDLDFTGIERIAAEHKGENFTQEELKFIQDTINFVVAKKRKLNKKDGQPND